MAICFAAWLYVSPAPRCGCSLKPSSFFLFFCCRKTTKVDDADMADPANGKGGSGTMGGWSTRWGNHRGEAKDALLYSKQGAKAPRRADACGYVGTTSAGPSWCCGTDTRVRGCWSPNLLCCDLAVSMFYYYSTVGLEAVKLAPCLTFSRYAEKILKKRFKKV